MTTRTALDSRAVGVMLVLCSLWSLQQISLKVTATDISPMLMVGLRSGIAALLVAAVMRWRGEGLQLCAGRWRPGLVAGGLFALEYLLIAEALRFTHASHVSVFLYTAPIFAALGLQWKLPSERLQVAQWLGIGIAFVGVAITFLARDTHASTPLGAQVLLGDGLALLAGAAWGATTVTIRCTSLGAAPATETLFYQLACAFVLLVPASLLLGQDRIELTPTVWAHLAFQAVVVSFASFLAWFWLLRHYLAAPLGVLAFLTPVFGVVLGVSLLDEPLEPGFVIGGAMALAGVVLVSAAGWWRARAPARTVAEG